MSEVPVSKVTGGNTGPRSRRWAYTNFAADLPNLDGSMKYHCRQQEICPKTGNKHFQGYIVFKNQCRLSTLVSKFSGVHWEVARGTTSQNIAYTSKSFGGGRRDWINSSGLHYTRSGTPPYGFGLVATRRRSHTIYGAPPSLSCRKSCGAAYPMGRMGRTSQRRTREKNRLRNSQ